MSCTTSTQKLWQAVRQHGTAVQKRVSSNDQCGSVEALGYLHEVAGNTKLVPRHFEVIPCNVLYLPTRRQFFVRLSSY